MTPVSRQGISFSPALAAGPDADTAKPTAAAVTAAAAASASAAGNGETGETLHTTIASGNAEGAETKSSLSMSIMELFDTNNGGGGGGVAAPVAVTPAARIGSGTAAAAALKSPLPLPPASAAPHAWNNVNSLTNQSKTAPPSTSTGGGGGAGRASLGSVGGAERHGYLSFSEVQVCEKRVSFLVDFFFFYTPCGFACFLHTCSAPLVAELSTFDHLFLMSLRVVSFFRCR